MIILTIVMKMMFITTIIVSFLFIVSMGNTHWINTGLLSNIYPEN